MAKNIGNIVGSASSDPRFSGVVTTSNSSIWTKQEHFYYAAKASWPKQIKTFIVELWGATGLDGGCSGANGGYNRSEISSFDGTAFSLVVSNGNPGFNPGGPSAAGSGGGSTGIAIGAFPSPTANWLAVAGGGGGGGSGPWTCSPGSSGSGSGGTGPASSGGTGSPPSGPSGKAGGGGAGVPGGGSGGVTGNNQDGGFGGSGGAGGVRPNASSVSMFVNSVTLLNSSDGSYSGLGSARITYNGVTSSFSAGVSTTFILW